MDATIFLFLLQDGIINGAVYALVAIATVLVFAVTRVILVPQGEFVAFTVLTIAALENGTVPATPWLLLALGCLAAASELVRHFRELTLRRVARIVLFDLALPIGLLLLTRTLAPMKLGQAANILLAIALITPMGPDDLSHRVRADRPFQRPGAADGRVRRAFLADRIGPACFSARKAPAPRRCRRPRSRSVISW